MTMNFGDCWVLNVDWELFMSCNCRHGWILLVFLLLSSAKFCPGCFSITAWSSYLKFYTQVCLNICSCVFHTYYPYITCVCVIWRVPQGHINIWTAHRVVNLTTECARRVSAYIWFVRSHLITIFILVPKSYGRCFSITAWSFCLKL